MFGRGGGITCALCLPRRSVNPRRFFAVCASQITLAALFSGWSHVLHGIYKPWGSVSLSYKVQHLSLFTTTFIFIMGLLFKVNTVAQKSFGFKVLSAVMLLLCVGFVAAWVAAMGRGVVITLKRKAKLREERRLRSLMGGEDEFEEEEEELPSVRHPRCRCFPFRYRVAL